MAYARVSSSLWDPDWSLEARSEAIRRLCEQEGRELTGSYEDNGPAVAKRPGLPQLKADASSGRFDTVVVVSHDRLARDVESALGMTEAFRELGIEVVSLT